MNIDFLCNIIVCFVLSLCIGLERQWRRRNIGLRTNVLVSLGSFLFVALAVNLNIDSDSTRIAAQVVSGIGFLGAGVILKDGTHIRGLNTAATLWCNAAIGVLCAYGFLFEATIGTIFILISNIILRMISLKLIDDYIRNDINYILTIVCKEKYTSKYREQIIDIISKSTMTLDMIDSSELDENKIKTQFYVSSRNDIEIEKMVTSLGCDPSILMVSYKSITEDLKKSLEADEV